MNPGLGTQAVHRDEAILRWRQVDYYPASGLPEFVSALCDGVSGSGVKSLPMHCGLVHVSVYGGIGWRIPVLTGIVVTPINISDPNFSRVYRMII